MALYQIYNNENIFIRAVLAGVLNILNNKIVYEQAWSTDNIEEVKVPWFYNMSGNERFMQDFYTFYGYCMPPKPVDGNFDIVPRGIITYMGSMIENSRITSRFVEGIYTKQENNTLETYRSFLYYIPLTISIDAEIRVDNFINALKLEQIINENFYKTVTFYVYYKGMRIGCTAGFPEQISVQKNVQYSFESDNPIKLTFSLAVETYQPVFDKTTEIKNNRYMTGIGFRIIDKRHENHDGDITITTNYENTIIPKEYPLLLEWVYKNENAIINKVDISWSNTGENERHLIKRALNNNEYFIWDIPEDFTSYKHPAIIWEETDDIKITTQPILRITPDIITGIITEFSFTIIERGNIITPTEDSSIAITLEMKDDLGNITYTGINDIYLNIFNNEIAETNPVVLPNGPIQFPGTIEPKIIDLYVSNSVVGYERELIGTDNEYSFGVIRNVTIV